MIGQVALIVAVALAVTSAAAGLLMVTVAPARSTRTTESGAGIDDGPSPDTWLLAGAAAGLWLAVGYLVVVILRLDTSFAYVARQTRADMGLPLRVSALWSGAEGSLLLFAAMTTTALVAGHRRAPVWQKLGTAVIAAGFGATVLQAANPFQRLDLPPLSGAGMAPILEHWAMVIHPPMLYAGLCLALTPALVRDRPAPGRPTPKRLTPQLLTPHRLALSSVALLTVALGLGSAWAYVELGWGGWWAWDPIENLALIVWLLLVAGLHWQPLDRDRLRGSGLTSAIIVWSLCWPAVLGGAAMTRTSLRTSVHAFADAAGLATWLWPLAAVATVGAGIRIWEDRPRTAGPLPTRLPQIVLSLAAFIIATGTYRPFVGGDGTAGWFYSRALYPLAVVGAILIGAVPRLATAANTQRPGPRQALAGYGVAEALIGAAVLTIAVAAAGWRQWFQLVLAAAVGAGGALVLSTGRRSAARLCGHLGILLVLFAALAGTASTENSVRLTIGESTEVEGHSVELISTEIVSEDPLRAEATVAIDGHELTPSVAVFPERNLRLPEVSTRTRPWLDTQAVLRDVDPEAGTLITVLFRPWNQLVWWGVALLTLAALLAIGGRDHTGRPRRDYLRSRLAFSNSSIEDGADLGAAGSGGGAGA